MEIRLLGPVEVRDGELVSALRRQERALLAALALRTGEVVPAERLVLDLWGERAPASASGSLQNVVSGLRKALGRDVLVTQAPGYRLALERDAVDANRFECLLADARTAESALQATMLEEALGLWHGPALADLDEEFARLEARRLDELRVVALEARIDTELDLGRHAALVGQLETFASDYPLRERLRGQLMLALYRCGRQAEALEVYRAARLALADELGLDPSPELQELERKILRQDPDLAPPAGARPETVARALERRLISVLAAIPPAEDDPETLRRRLDELLTKAREVLARNDGVLERFGPEVLVAVFGAVAPRDDDAIRAARAAAELGLPAGVATGESVGGAGAVFTRAVELAHRGGFQVDERTRALVEHERRLDLALIGRTEEMARLRARYEAAKTERRCNVVTVLGEPGIGKTRLGRELTTALAADATTLVGRCFSYGKGQTFLPLADAFKELDVAAVLAAEPERELATTRLAALAGGEDADTLGETYWAVRRLLEALAGTRPVLLLLDDVHWAEPALLDLVDYLAAHVTDARILIVSLARPELKRPAGEQLLLGPLAPDETRQLVALLAELDEETRERVVELADGNALYAEQLAAFAADGGEGLPATLEAVLAGRIGRLAEPERRVLQHAAVAGREFSRGVVAALSDQPVDAALASLCRRSLVHPAATAEPGDDGYRFHHVLLRDAAYATLTKADRARLHERVAEWLDRAGPGDHALVGYHLEQAAFSRRELGEDADEIATRAGERLGQAGMRVWRTNDVAAGVGLLERAVALLSSGQRLAELELERAIALRLHDRPDEAGEALASAEREAREASSGRMQARVACERAVTRLLAGELTLDRAASILTNAMAELRAAGDARGQAAAELCLCVVHWFACRYDQLVAAAARAEQHYTDASLPPSSAVLGFQAEHLYFGAAPVASAIESCAELLERSPNLVARARTTAVMGALRALEGNTADAQRLLAHARSLYEEIGFEQALLLAWTTYFVQVEMIAGNHNAAKAAARTNIVRLQASGDVAHASTQAVLLADMLLDEGATDEADEYVRLAENKANASNVYVQFLRRSARARILARTGRTTEAEEMAREAVSIASLTDALRDRARTHFALAEVLQLAGKSHAAQAEATAGRKLLRQKGATALLQRHKAAPLAQR